MVRYRSSLSGFSAGMIASTISSKFGFVPLAHRATVLE
jgi:hypothetical protein